MAIMVTGKHDNYIVRPRPLLDVNRLVRAPDAKNEISGRALALLDTGKVTYYVCTSSATVNYYFLMIANTVMDNTVVEDLVATLEKLQNLVAHHNYLYRDSGRVLPKPEGLGFDHLFPLVVDHFICGEQGNRAVLILDFSFTDLSYAIVASQLPEENVRVDLRTSCWILARLLKLTGFLNLNQLTMPIGLESILLERATHRLMWLDWTSLAEHEDNLDAATRRLGLKQVATAIFSLLGASFNGQEWQYQFFSTNDEQREQEENYFRLLTELMNGKFDNAVAAHQVLNKVFYEIWPTEFYPFTAYTYANNRTLVDEQNML